MYQNCASFRDSPLGKKSLLMFLNSRGWGQGGKQQHDSDEEQIDDHDDDDAQKTKILWENYAKKNRK